MEKSDSKTTTVKLHKETVKALSLLKLYRRETHEDIILKLIDYYRDKNLGEKHDNVL